MQELLTPYQMAQADRLAVDAGVPSLTLMENAGQAIAYEVAQHFSVQPVLVLCGPGNNGGDGFVVARLLAERGWPVRVGLFGDKADLRGDAAIMARKWNGGHIEPALACLDDDFGVIIDALIGSGLSRDIDGELAEVIEKVNQCSADVVAVDMPSGVDGATGAERGVAIRANFTVTFFRCKPGHLLYPGGALCGEVLLADIGIPDHVLADIVPTAFENDPHLWHLPKRSPAGHKYDAGHCLVVSGAAFQTGAARLAANGAARVGAGLVTIAGDRAALSVHANHVTSIMLVEAEDHEALAETLRDRRKNSVVIGPGLGTGGQSRDKVLTALRSEARVVLDADAITSFHEDPETLFAAIDDRGRGEVVLTPHHGEFERLFGTLEGSKIDRARRAAELAGAVVLYKGPDTVIARPEGRVVINGAASPLLATAGAGDVLAGAIAGLMAQGMSDFDAACAAVFLHGLGTKLFGKPGLMADDLPDIVREMLVRVLE
ncbi:NAD(P)H-hydrate dehydratase [Pelagibacterium xiamenense]|uniref:NAD(P)H-hydrate dehydratase n=1 Tax=Pelagibacterium xiamenense TaxID=2901140 RepID=UPI001E4289FD|nr:NAD(P)H-hydrate dehydratase [Pelagibacterium xiamenense]